MAQYDHKTPATQQKKTQPTVTTTLTGKCIQPAKLNSIDNQRVAPKNPKITGNKPEINNKLNMTTKPQHPPTHIL
jgi:hypothetical protein